MDGFVTVDVEQQLHGTGFERSSHLTSVPQTTFSLCFGIVLLAFNLTSYLAPYTLVVSLNPNLVAGDSAGYKVDKSNDVPEVYLASVI
jgi:hypothetical protein